MRSGIFFAAVNLNFMDQDGKFEVRMNAPGFEPDEVKVTALPDALIVSASSSHTHENKEGNVRFCEFGQKTMFRRFDLPEPINLDKATADLSKGVLHLTVAKAKREAVPKPKAIAA
jgi:HSP20 family protein